MKGETALFLRANLWHLRYVTEAGCWLKVFEFSGDAIEAAVLDGLLPWYEQHVACVHLNTPSLGLSWRCKADVDSAVLEQASFVRISSASSLS